MDAPPPTEGPTVELFELVPPMDPPARPDSLISAGLAAISSVYGSGGGAGSKSTECGHNKNNIDDEGFGHNNGQGTQMSSFGSTGAGSSGLMMAPLVAAAFRCPAVPVPSAPVPFYHPSTYSASSDPCTPSSVFFPTSPYASGAASCLSPMSALDPLGMAFAWNFLGTGDVIGYCSELTSTTSSSDSPSALLDQHHPHLPHIAYPQTPVAAPSAPPLLVHHTQPAAQQHIFHTNNFNFGPPAPPQPNKKSSKSAGGQAMPRTSTKAATRKGGRRPREAEQNETPEDQNKKAKRRERNKQAAARCRRRREEKMETLQEQVTELREQNERREQEIQKLRQKEMRLLELLRLQSGGCGVVQRHQSLHVQAMDHLVQSASPSALLQPSFLIGDTRKRSSATLTMAATTSSSSASSSSSSSACSGMLKREEEEIGTANNTTDDNGDSTTGTDESPMVPNAVGGHFPGALVNGVDPVISESALPHHHAMSMTSFGSASSTSTIVSAVAAKRLKFEQFDASHSARPTTLQLNTLYREGFVADTPSKELGQFGGGGGVGGTGGIGMTPGSELITPGLGHLAQLAESSTSFGDLMAQQTGLTPCQQGPVPVLQGGERPTNGELSELR